MQRHLKTRSKSNSYLLVIQQFVFIALLLLLHGIQMPNTFALLLFFLGALFGLYTIRHNKPGNFNITPEIKNDALLITTGAYQYIRHPMYFSLLLMMLGVVLSKPSMLSFFVYALLVVTLSLKAKKEEMLWIKRSNEYKNYMQKTKRIIPFLL